MEHQVRSPVLCHYLHSYLPSISERCLHSPKSRGIDILRSGREHKTVGLVRECLHVGLGQALELTRKISAYVDGFGMEVGTRRRRSYTLGDHSVRWFVLGGWEQQGS